MAVNTNFSMPDVMIDATVAVKAKLHPSLAADLQSLCWGSHGAFGTPAALVAGVALKHVGVRLVFALSAAATAAVALPAALGWLGEPRVGAMSARRRWKRLTDSPTKRAVASAAALVGGYSVLLALVQLAAGRHSSAVSTFTVCGDLALAVGVWSIMRRVDECLARTCAYVFLVGALVPSAPILFEWAHDPAKNGDDRCSAVAECAERAAAHLATAPSSSAASAGAAGAEVAAGAAAASMAAEGATAAGALPCGWARARGYPCLSPQAYSYAEVLSSAALLGGTILYNTAFQRWPYRRIIMASQLFLGALSLVDLLWVWRLNVRLGLPDLAFILGEEVIATVVRRLATMPFMVFAAKVCAPPQKHQPRAPHRGASACRSEMAFGLALCSCARQT